MKSEKSLKSVFSLKNQWRPLKTHWKSMILWLFLNIFHGNFQQARFLIKKLWKPIFSCRSCLKHYIWVFCKTEFGRKVSGASSIGGRAQKILKFAKIQRNPLIFIEKNRVGLPSSLNNTVAYCSKIHGWDRIQCANSYCCWYLAVH